MPDTSFLLIQRDLETHDPLDSMEKSGGKAYGIVLMLLVGMFVSFSIIEIADTLYRTVMLISILWALLLPMIIRHLTDGLDVFEPLAFANLSLGSMFIGRPIYDMAADSWWFQHDDVQAGFDRMLQYALLGIVAFQFGYLCTLPTKLAARMPKFQQGIDPAKAIKISLGVFVLGVVLYAEYVRESGGIGFLIATAVTRSIGAQYNVKTASGYLAMGPLFWPLSGMLAFSVWLKSRKFTHLLLTIVVMACFFADTFGSGTRTLFIQGTVGFAVIWYVSRRRRPSVITVTVVMVLALFYLTFSREMRNQTTFAAKEATLQTVVQNPKHAIISIWAEDDAAMSDYLCLFMDNVPGRMPFDHFAVIKDTLLRAYPRFLFPGNRKPDEHIVSVFKFFFPQYFYRYSSGAACSIIGEFYLDSGWISVVIGMFLLGVTLGIPKPWLRLTDQVLPVQLFYVAMPAYTISVMRGGFPAFILYIGLTFVPILLLGFAAKPDEAGITASKTPRLAGARL